MGLVVLLDLKSLAVEYLGTRPSALGMSDPIWGPLIHIFVDEKKIEKDKDLDQVNCEYTALRFLNF